MIIDVAFTDSDPLIVNHLATVLAGWSPVTIDTELPATKVRRMVTVRDDSGPQEGVQSRRRYGVNVWADTNADSKQIALDAMAGLRRISGASTDSFTGPFRIPTDTPFIVTVGSTKRSLTNYYFQFRASVKGTNA